MKKNKVTILSFSVLYVLLGVIGGWILTYIIAIILGAIFHFESTTNTAIVFTMWLISLIFAPLLTILIVDLIFKKLRLTLKAVLAIGSGILLWRIASGPWGF